MEKIKLQDDSGDKKYFTIVPNYIANHSTANDQALYMQMKRVAGENGKCTASKEYFMKQLGIGKKKLKESFKYLLDHGWIRLIGQGGGMTKQINTYEIVDIWDLNNEYFTNKKRGSKIDTFEGGLKETERGAKSELKGGPEETLEEEHSNKNINNKDATQSVAPANIRNFFNKNRKDELIPMTLQEFVLMCRGSEYRHIRLIGEYAEVKETNLTDRGQWRAFGLRNMRVARRLAPYTDKQIESCHGRTIGELKK